jgi:site-specific DNA recombinase
MKPAGWTWQPTGETFGGWWARRGITARNVWLRSMNVRLGFDDRVHLDLGDIFGLTQQVNAAARWPSGKQSLQQWPRTTFRNSRSGSDGPVITPREAQPCARTRFDLVSPPAR